MFEMMRRDREFCDAEKGKAELDALTARFSAVAMFYESVRVLYDHPALGDRAINLTSKSDRSWPRSLNNSGGKHCVIFAKSKN